MAVKDGETQSCSFPLCNNAKKYLERFLNTLEIYHTFLLCCFHGEKSSKSTNTDLVPVLLVFLSRLMI